MKKATGFYIFSFIAAVFLLGLPLLGIMADGKNPEIYMEFPPLTTYVVPAKFSWPIFGLISLIELFMYGWLGFLLFCAWKLIKKRAGEKRESKKRVFPWWGWLAVFVCIISWVLAWTRFSWFEVFQRHTFIPLWFSYIFIVNALVFRRSGRCMMKDRPMTFALLFLASAFFWWFFEYLNRFVQNWHYCGVEDFNELEYICLASVSFSTVLPAVLGTGEFLLTFRVFQGGLKSQISFSVPHSKALSVMILIFSGIGLAFVGVYPSFLYPLLWVSPLFIIVSLKSLCGLPNVFNGLKNGDWRELVAYSLAALICGFFWEMWNYYSFAKWVYTVPFVGRFFIFEMPLLGFAGYLPFGLECLAIGKLFKAEN